MPMKAGGGAKRNASNQQSTQVSTATTTRHRHTDKLSGVTYQPVYLPWPAKREGRGGANCRTNAQIRARNCMTSRASTRHLTLDDLCTGLGRINQ